MKISQLPFRFTFPWICLLCIGISLLLYSTNLTTPFLLDDPPNITGRADVAQPNHFWRFLIEPYTYQSPESGAFRPMVMISIWLTYLFAHDSTWPYHLTNIILHGVVSALVWQLSTLLTKKPKLSLLLALLFLFHPISTEAVDSIINRSELLAALGILGGISIFWRKLTWQNQLLIAGGIFYSLLSKESTLGILPLFALLWLWPINKQNTNLTTKISGLTLLTLTTAGYFFLRWKALGQYLFANAATMVENPLRYVSPIQRISTSLVIFVDYVIKIFLPLHLSADYSYPQIAIVSLSHPLAIIGLVGLFSLICLTCWSVIKQNQYFIGLCLIIGPYLITSNLLMPIGTVMADRLLYLPLAGVILTFASLISTYWWPKHQSLVMGCLICLSIILGVRTIWRNQAWTSAEHLFLTTAKTAPRSVLARSNASSIYYLQGNLDKAIAEATTAHQLYPAYGPNLYNLGQFALFKGDIVLAEKWYKQTIETANYYSNAHYALAKLLYYQKRYDEVISFLDQPHPSHQQSEIALYRVLSLIRLNRMEEAKQTLVLLTSPYDFAYAQTILEQANKHQTQADSWAIKAVGQKWNDEELLAQAILSFQKAGDAHRASKYFGLLKQITTPYSNQMIEQICHKPTTLPNCN